MVPSITHEFDEIQLTATLNVREVNPYTSFVVPVPSQHASRLAPHRSYRKSAGDWLEVLGYP
ncbi:MAG TPA: hypothetical protein VEH81_09725 [Ktedonobacteraceae bacterium]|nr:hypothetical protein [Ktedonobacteraceae bacterium]